jgi:transposase-like protein
MPFPYRFQRIRPDQARAIALAHRSGAATAPQLAREYGVTARTIFRVLRRAEAMTTTLRAGPWRAAFALTDEGPVQIEPWRPRIQE